LGPTALGFRHRDDLRAILQILEQLQIDINVVAPFGATPTICAGSATPIST
jgi:light-independent protochlorophyllide reductase subunit B